MSLKVNWSELMMAVVVVEVLVVLWLKRDGSSWRILMPGRFERRLFRWW